MQKLSRYSDFHNDCLFFSRKKKSSSISGAEAHRFGLCSQRSVSILFFLCPKKKTIIMEIRVCLHVWTLAGDLNQEYAEAVFVYVCMYVCMYVWTLLGDLNQEYAEAVFMYVCMYVCMYGRCWAI